MNMLLQSNNAILLRPLHLTVEGQTAPCLLWHLKADEEIVPSALAKFFVGYSPRNSRSSPQSKLFGIEILHNSRNGHILD